MWQAFAVPPRVIEAASMLAPALAEAQAIPLAGQSDSLALSYLIRAYQVSHATMLSRGLVFDGRGKGGGEGAGWVGSVRMWQLEVEGNVIVCFVCVCGMCVCVCPCFRLALR